ncbi:MAG: rhomboid family intramembrane serine protease [Bacteriovorax sp.]|nr:rhomboid family intramembrane serine protease [Bacteriovorax sp.]
MQNSHSQIYLPKLTPINKFLIIIASSFFILEFILTKTSTIYLGNILGLSAERIIHGHLYSLITYPFLSHSIIEVILNCLMLWLMGSEFEANWGTKRYLNFILSVVIGGGLLYLGVCILFFSSSPVYSFPLIGLSGIVSSLCLAYAVIFPDRIFSFMMLIPVKAKYFCMILVAISLYQGLSGPTGAGAWGQLGGILSAYLFMILVSNRNFKLLSEKMGQLTQRRSVKKSKAKLTIVKDDNEHPPKYWQ